MTLHCGHPFVGSGATGSGAAWADERPATNNSGIITEATESPGGRTGSDPAQPPSAPGYMAFFQAAAAIGRIMHISDL